MKPIIARIDFTLRDEKYTKGKEVKVNSKEELIRLNERGFIEPFSYAEIQEYITAFEKTQEETVEVNPDENVDENTELKEENKKRKKETNNE